mmetsp:Transcript_3600/g.6835  ORF Transcript_3600/g.6835 Transcript_3600/m.6835 type:complete len:114 (+) Transcript_3600:1055-1396(+)
MVLEELSSMVVIRVTRNCTSSPSRHRLYFEMEGETWSSCNRGHPEEFFSFHRARLDTFSEQQPIVQSRIHHVLEERNRSCGFKFVRSTAQNEIRGILYRTFLGVRSQTTQVQC